MTIQAGHYDAIKLPDGTLQKHPRSISFANMDEIEFQQLYKAALDVLWRWILSKAFRDQWRGGERRCEAHELCGVTGMKKTWFHHTDCTTQQAEELMAEYQRRGVKVERNLNSDYLTRPSAPGCLKARNHRV